MNLCDSDWMIDLLKGREAARQLLNPMISQGIAISIISVGEVYQGIIFGSEPEWNELKFLELLDQLVVLSPDIVTIRIYATLRGQLKGNGLPLPDNDLQIAATALRHELTLVTRNRRHFDRIPGLRLYEAEV